MIRCIGIILGVLLTSSALAATIDFSSTIKDLDGNPILKCDIDKPVCKEPTTLAFIADNALLAPDRQNEQPMTGDDKARHYILALRIHPGGKIEVSAEDIVLLKKVIEQSYSPLIVGRAKEILDPSFATPTSPKASALK